MCHSLDRGRARTVPLMGILRDDSHGHTRRAAVAMRVRHILLRLCCWHVPRFVCLHHAVEAVTRSLSLPSFFNPSNSVMSLESPGTFPVFPLSLPSPRPSPFTCGARFAAQCQSFESLLPLSSRPSHLPSALAVVRASQPIPGGGGGSGQEVSGPETKIPASRQHLPSLPPSLPHCLLIPPPPPLPFSLSSAFLFRSSVCPFGDIVRHFYRLCSYAVGFMAFRFKKDTAAFRPIC